MRQENKNRRKNTAEQEINGKGEKSTKSAKGSCKEGMKERAEREGGREPGDGAEVLPDVERFASVRAEE